ncbi:MAG: hypothetical protein HFF17_01745 [Oscillospiraceae bacterium]|nr:hypothetical protein [Oscillospiraceae bacterium]
MMKQAAAFCCGAAAALLFLTLLGPVPAAERRVPAEAGVRVYIDGRALVPRDETGAPVEVLTCGGTVYLPVRALCEALGRQVWWDAAGRRVFIR